MSIIFRVFMITLGTKRFFLAMVFLGGLGLGLGEGHPRHVDLDELSTMSLDETGELRRCVLAEMFRVDELMETLERVESRGVGHVCDDY
jgi:hypothetical protein